MTTIDDLTAAQRRALPLLLKSVSWSPYEAPKTSRGELVRRSMLRRLQKLGVAHSYDLGKPGDDPIYEASLTDEGKQIVEAARAVVRRAMAEMCACCIIDGYGPSSENVFATEAGFGAWIHAMRRETRCKDLGPGYRSVLRSIEAIGHEAAMAIVADAWTETMREHGERR